MAESDLEPTSPKNAPPGEPAGFILVHVAGYRRHRRKALQTPDHVFVAEACYACSDGEWSSYTRATTIRDPRVPPAIAQDAALPERVARWIAAHPGARGLSVAPASQLALFAGQGGADASAAVDGEDAAASAEATGEPGVASASTDEPVKQANFPKPFERFALAKSYSEWIFEYVPVKGPIPVVSHPNQPSAAPPVLKTF